MPYPATEPDSEKFPSEAVDALTRQGLQGLYIPASLGGRLTDHTELLTALRTIAARDLTLAIAHGKTFLGAVGVWLSGSPEQTARLAALITEGAPVALALTEPEHGADLLATDTTAVRTERGFVLRGRKWPVNNATRGRLLCLLAKGEGDALNLHLIDKEDLPDSGWRHLPKVPTHGIRGADISGIEFDGVTVPAGTLIGTPGSGLATVVKGLQLTRTMCAALSLGAADHALRLALANDDTTPWNDEVLATALADRLINEAVALVAARSIHALPGEMAVMSAVVKYLVPTRTDRLLEDLADLAGPDGDYREVVRDHRVVGLFDGSTVVNLASLTAQFPLLLNGYRSEHVDHDGLRAALDLSAPPPAFAPEHLSPLAIGGSSVLNALPAHTRSVTGPAAGQVESLKERVDTITARLGGPAAPNGRAPAERLHLAARLTEAVAAAACVGLWLANAYRLDTPLWTDAAWLRLALWRLENTSPLDPRLRDICLAESRATSGRTPSLMPC
ncbi:acyl-CoA dehydrogenase family protein [Phytomonospora endophytica]|uniref:Alkylation response protein AidB-like acyl-CoA dehydrogenase n=1 Tax=Phytomonospora endophytica TaxID=714109 RepID=A0A841FI86_9ACTN|nr:acyl-CoA dehydrogenase family protein [Phytomonospora endophytica]MBB6035574.1 alkylation response protein AidB-like acyl-CoA dehydrogenase [Phytomonospora endophytica]GIG70063.1 acyl-CoA dehydrogenase [Phytomonospora endophytica]